MTPKSFLGEFEQMVLLAILQSGDHAFALEVRRELEARAGRSVSRGAFYTILDRLEGKGLLRWDEEGPPDGRTSQQLRTRSSPSLWAGGPGPPGTTGGGTPGGIAPKSPEEPSATLDPGHPHPKI